MKGKIFFLMILSAILLTACGAEDVPAEREVQTESGIETTLKTETTSAETAFESAEVTEKEAAEISGTTSSEYFDYFTFDLGKYETESTFYESSTHRECMLLSQNLLCAIYQYQEPDSDRQHYLRIYDIDNDKMLADILLPDNGQFFAYGYEKNTGDALVKVYYTAEKDGSYKYCEMTVHKDYSYDIVDDGSTPYPGIDYFNTGIYGNEPGTDILENLRTNEILVDVQPGGMVLYGSSIDENRFTFNKRVYDDSGYDSNGYIGIYDYETGTVTEFPDSNNLDLIGYYDGKIYACESNSASHHVEDGIGTVYSFDINTLEKKNFMTFHTSDDNIEGNITCHMTWDCGYMSVVLSYSTSAETAYIISLDSGEILAKHETDSETADGELREIMYADGRVVLTNFSDDKLLVLDPK